MTAPTAPNPAFFAVPGTLRLGTREFVVPAPAPSDAARVHRKMKELASRSCVSPLEYVSANREKLDPVTLTEAIRAAVAIGSGGGVQPHREAIMDAYDTLEGVRWRIWWAVRKGDKAITLEAVSSLVTEDNYYEAAEDLHKALGLDDLEKKAPSNGES